MRNNILPIVSMVVILISGFQIAYSGDGDSLQKPSIKQMDDRLGYIGLIKEVRATKSDSLDSLKANQNPVY